MSKYVIEFEDNPWYQDDYVGYYKCGEIPWWSAKKSDIKKLTPLDKALDEAYQNGVHDGSLDVKERVEGAYQKGFEAGSHETTTLEYQQGLNDAWGTIIKIALIPYAERSETFDGQQDILSIVQKFSPSEAVAMLREYEQQKADEIKVGDEVRNTLGLMDNAVGFVIGITIEGDYNVSRYIDGKIKTGTWCSENCVKTGKHSDTVVQLLAEMEGGVE